MNLSASGKNAHIKYKPLRRYINRKKEYTTISGVFDFKYKIQDLFRREDIVFRALARSSSTLLHKGVVILVQ